MIDQVTLTKYDMYLMDREERESRGELSDKEKAELSEFNATLALVKAIFKKEGAK